MDAVQRRMDLAGWLAGLPRGESDHLVLGGTGHLLLSTQEQANAREHLLGHVLPTLFARPGLRRISLITGLAPGADLLFKRHASDWLRKAGVEFEAVALLPVPVDVLIGDWVAKAHEEWAPVANGELDAMRGRLDDTLADCDVIVDLLPAGTSAIRLEQARFRQDQYRRLAACLAEQTDVLIALLREQKLQQPGGTAEVVEWRRNPGRVPMEFSTLTLRKPPVGRRRLVIIDPSVTVGSQTHDTATIPKPGGCPGAI